MIVLQISFSLYGSLRRIDTGISARYAMKQPSALALVNPVSCLLRSQAIIKIIFIQQYHVVSAFAELRHILPQHTYNYSSFPYHV